MAYIIKLLTIKKKVLNILTAIWIKIYLFLYLLTTPISPSLTGMTLPMRTSIASVPASIRSSLVTTASVLRPNSRKENNLNAVSLKKNLHHTAMWKNITSHKLKGTDIVCKKTHKQTKINLICWPSGSTSRATFRASEVAMSVFAAVTAKMMQLGLLMYFKISSRICSSISLGWSPTGTWTWIYQCQHQKIIHKRIIQTGQAKLLNKTPLWCQADPPAWDWQHVARRFSVELARHWSPVRQWHNICIC